MRKWLWFGVVGLSFVSLSHIFASDWKADRRATMQIESNAVVPVVEVTASSPILFDISLGDDESQVVAKLGQPARKEVSPLGYKWWVYNQDLNRFIQIGMLNGRVVDIFSHAPLAKIGQVGIGTTYQSLSRKHEVKRVVTFKFGNADVEVTNEMRDRPLMLVNGIPVIFYIDRHNNNKVTGMRVIDKVNLLRGSFYETKWTYQGDSPDFDAPTLTLKQQDAVTAAHERQILDLVNAVRFRYKLPMLTWNEQAAEVARGHSNDMASNQFFDHKSPTTGLDPFARLKKRGITYKMAGENIAAGFPDAIEAHHSWMNSIGHRKNVLEKDFTQLGVGVVTNYYTQNFITPWK